MLPPVLLPDLTSQHDISESQIMSSLNSSIEDLLSKISQVQQEHQVSSYQQSKNASSHFGSFKNGLGKAKAERNPRKCYTTATNFIQSDKHMATDLNKESDEASFHHNSSRSESTPSILAENWQQNAEGNYPSLKKLKIQSLFDHQSVKQLASSQIISDDPQQHSQHLFLSTREVSQIIIEAQTFRSAIPKEVCLNQFEVGHSIGSGKFGQVYICRHKQTGFLFALKKIFKSTIRQYRMEEQFCLQIKLLYMLDHPNIVKLYGHFSDDYHIFLLMEYVEGGQLMNRIGSHQRYFSQVLGPLIEAVEHLHSRNIIHRDIKPENIVIAFDDTPKLCDFGWAAACDRSNMRQTFCGTLDYLSPQMKDNGPYSFSVDLWSLGVLAYELLTGTAPFKQELLHWRKRGSNKSLSWDWRIIYPPSVSALAESFMQNLLRENPDERSSLRFCRNHFFIRKYKTLPIQISELKAMLDI